MQAQILKKLVRLPLERIGFSFFHSGKKPDNPRKKANALTLGNSTTWQKNRRYCLISLNFNLFNQESTWVKRSSLEKSTGKTNCWSFAPTGSIDPEKL
jgi:hypothetical protein